MLPAPAPHVSAKPPFYIHPPSPPSRLFFFRSGPRPALPACSSARTHLFLLRRPAAAAQDVGESPAAECAPRSANASALGQTLKNDNCPKRMRGAGRRDSRTCRAPKDPRELNPRTSTQAIQVSRSISLEIALEIFLQIGIGCNQKRRNLVFKRCKYGIYRSCDEISFFFS